MMIDEMRQALLDIFGMKDDLRGEFGLENKGTGRFLVYMSDSEYAPPIDRKDKVGSWIGYRFMEKTRYARSWTQQIGINEYLCVPMQFRLRLAFVGKQAEELAETTMTWEDRTDVQHAFESRGFQMMYNRRNLYAYAVKQEGFNDIISWTTDISGTGVVKIDTKLHPWSTR